MISVRRNRRQSEGGFALLLIFAFAAAVAIGIYRELPRAVFESARAKEELLVERGQQYQLAIRRYYAKTKTYPQTLEQLEETNGVRFLRRRYKDPMTGKDEWRLIHIGPGGYTDSKVFKPQNPAEKKQVYESSITQGYSVGQAPAAATQQGIQGVAMRQRPGDQARPGQELPDTEPESPAANVHAGNDPPTEAAGEAPPPPAEGADRQQQPPNPGVLPFPPGQIPPNQPVQTPPPPPSGSFTPATLPSGIGPPASGPGAQPPNPALQMIQNQLRSPQRSGAGAGGGFAGPAPAGPAGAPQGATLIGGIAGVASKYEGEGIKRIHDRSRIDEWEFLFDASKMTGQNQQAAAQGPGQGQTPAPGGGAAGPQPPSLNRPAPASSGAGTAFGGSSSFGSSTSFGGSTSFGTPPPPAGQQPPQRPPGLPPGMGGMGQPGMGNRPRP